MFVLGLLLALKLESDCGLLLGGLSARHCCLSMSVAMDCDVLCREPQSGFAVTIAINIAMTQNIVHLGTFPSHHMQPCCITIAS